MGAMDVNSVQGGGILPPPPPPSLEIIGMDHTTCPVRLCTFECADGGPVCVKCDDSYVPKKEMCDRTPLSCEIVLQIALLDIVS